MRKFFPVLFIGSLSILFAEIYSGASKAWFFDPFGWLVTFPLYTAHVVFFLYISVAWKKCRIWHLYLFGILFALYESWITKVLWCGYFDQTGPGFGTLAGLAMPETLILVFFWHPVMSFLVPVLVFEGLTGVTIFEHEPVLRKTRGRMTLLGIFSGLMGAFVANGNGLNPVSVSLSFLGTLLIVVLFLVLSRGKDLQVFFFPRKWFFVLCIYLVGLYTLTFFFLLPERIPHSPVPYFSVLGLYAIVLGLLFAAKGGEQVRFVKLNSTHFSHVEFVIFTLTTFSAALLFCFLGIITRAVLLLHYLSLCFLGPGLFCLAAVLVWRERG
ncbi:MAG: hypothetical protein N3F63_05265 [Thermoplasmata archaeon]|nr:hypothetical protein [Thermoplasmata archaeon]